MAAHQPTNLVIRGGPPKKPKRNKVLKAWEAYIRDESLEENWQRFLHDLGLGEFSSKKKCKKALKNIWINIVDFLAAVRARDTAAEAIQDEQAREAALAAPVQVRFFTSQAKLARYTVQTGKVFPRRHIAEDSPLKLLMAHIFRYEE